MDSVSDVLGWRWLDPRWRCGEALGPERAPGPTARLETHSTGLELKPGGWTGHQDTMGKEDRFLMARGPLLREVSRDLEGAARDRRRNQEKGAGRAHEDGV